MRALLTDIQIVTHMYAPFGNGETNTLGYHLFGMLSGWSLGNINSRFISTILIAPLAFEYLSGYLPCNVCYI